jgi:hypothetical protein
MNYLEVKFDFDAMQPSIPHYEKRARDNEKYG